MNELAITLDIDWAPDFMIERVAGALLSKGVKATWFVTHRSLAIDRLRHHPELFELGIHPNFAAGSSHGDTPEAVLGHVIDLVPDAVDILNGCMAGEHQPLTVKAVEKYYREYRIIWTLFLAFRRVDRWLTTKLMRRRYEFILPGRIRR